MDDSPSLPPPPPTAPPPLLPDMRTVAAFVTVIVFVLFIFLGASVQLLNVAFGVWFTEVFIFLGAAWVALRRSGHLPARYTGFHFPGLKPTAFGFFLGVANFFAFVVPLQFTSQALLPESWQHQFDSSQIFQGRSTVELVAIIAGVTLAAPVCEEFYFRGLLQRGLQSGGNAARAVALSAVIFSAFHLDPVGFLARTELGVLFGLLALRTGSLWPGILAHAANNLVSTVLYFSAKGFEDTLNGQAASSLEQLKGVLTLTLMGAVVFWWLLSAARHSPSLLEAHPAARAREAVAVPSPPLTRLVLPWVLGASLSLAGLFLVDSRGMQLSFFDARHPLPRVPQTAPDARHAERQALMELRQSARRGEVPLEAYMEERVRQEREARQQEDSPPEASQPEAAP